MDRQVKQDFIRRIAELNSSQPSGESILWSRHGISELLNEGWARSAVERGLERSEIIEDYRTITRPLPDCLVIGWIEPDEPFHAVVAIDEPNDRLLIVTVYKPTASEWENDWQIRKR